MQAVIVLNISGDGVSNSAVFKDRLVSELEDNLGTVFVEVYNPKFSSADADKAEDAGKEYHIPEIIEVEANVQNVLLASKKLVIKYDGEELVTLMGDNVREEAEKMIKKPLCAFGADGISINGAFLSLKQIINECNLVKTAAQKLVLMVMKWGSRRGFDGIKESRVLPTDRIERIKEIIVGQEIYFGEIAGKNSDIYGTLEDGDIQIIENKEDVLKFLAEHPKGYEYDHSFFYTFLDYAEDGGYEDDETLTEQVIKELKGLITFELA